MFYKKFIFVRIFPVFISLLSALFLVSCGDGGGSGGGVATSSSASSVTPDTLVVDTSTTGQYLLPGTTWKLFSMFDSGGAGKSPSNDESFILKFSKIVDTISNQKGHVSLTLKNGNEAPITCSVDDEGVLSVYEIKTEVGYQVEFENSSCNALFYSQFPIFTNRLYSFEVVNRGYDLKLTAPDGTIYFFEISAIEPQ